MAQTVRIASFNFENFFQRAVLLNHRNDLMKPKLERVASLLAELRKKKYDAAKIDALYKEVREYVVVRANKGKLFSQKGKLVAKGADDWEGWLELKTERISTQAQEMTLQVVAESKADVVCCIEMDDRPTLVAVGRSKVFGKNRYRHAMLIDGNDARGIDVGLLSHHPIADLRSHVDDRTAKGSPIFSRDCLEARVELPAGRALHVFANHLKSQGYGDQKSNNAKRLAQSERVAEILKGYDLAKDWVVVAGDLNAAYDGPNKASLAPLLAHPGLEDVLRRLPNGADWAYYYDKKRQRLDYLLCSKALAKRVKAVGVIRKGMWQLATATGGVEKPYPEVKGATSAASDHGLIWMDVAL